MTTEETCPSGRTSCTPFDCVCDPTPPHREPAGAVGLVPGDATEENVATVAALLAATAPSLEQMIAAVPVDAAAMRHHKAGVMAERARIVAWLRGVHCRARWAVGVGSGWDMAADAIESGEYQFDEVPRG